jgi:hypothetical protein
MSRALCLLLICLAFAAPAAAQQKEPLAPFVVDVHGIYARHKAEPSVATELDVEPGNLPTRSFGLAAGAHVYVLRSSKLSLGIGANAVFARGSKTQQIVEDDAEEPVDGPTVRRHFMTVSPEISLNFGHRYGWSYISGGMFGRSKLYLDRADAPASDAPYRATINYGGGARWFTNDHVAFSVDFRWYSVAEQPAAAGLVAQPRTTLLMLSGGISLK